MKENKVSRVLKDQAIWLVFIVLVIAFTIANPRFITMSNLLIMLRQVAVWGIASVGMMFVILLGDIDLGTGSVITFVNILCAKLMVEFGVNMYLAVLISLLASTLIGLLNGFMVATIGIPALIATFATQTAFSGIALIMCNGQPINGFPEKFSVFGAGWVGPVPIPVIIMIICFIIGAFILNKTYFGRYFYAVGGNIEAARLSGTVQEELNIWYLHYQDFLQDLPVLYFCHEQIPVWVMQDLATNSKLLPALSLEVCL